MVFVEVTIYARISLSIEGDQTSVDNQVQACKDFIARQGWTVGPVLIDNSISATSGARRPAFEDLLESKPAAVVVWHIDRLVRVSEDLEKVIELGVNVHALQAGHLDLSTPTGRAVARTVVAWATYEGEHKSERQRLSMRAARGRGRPWWSHRPFGHNKDGTLREQEAAEIRRWASGLLEGRPLRALAREAGERGITGTTGKPLRHQSLRSILLQPRMVSIATYNGEEVADGDWEPVLDRATWVAVVALLRNPSRRNAPGARTLLSGVALCGVCLGPIRTTSSNGHPAYTCTNAMHVSRKREQVDAIVGERVCALLQRPEIGRALSKYRGGDLGDSVARLASLRGRLEDAAAAYTAGGITIAQLTSITQGLRDQIEDLERKVARNTKNSPLHLILSAEDVQAKWGVLGTAQRREIVRQLFDVVIDPAPKGRGKAQGDHVRTPPAGEATRHDPPAPQ